MPLKRKPEPVDHAAILRMEGLDPAEGYLPDAGDTSPPADAAAPKYEIECTPADGQYTAKIVIEQPASEGNNTSIYLKAGVFETNASLAVQLFEKDRRKSEAVKVGSYLGKFKDDPRNRVYLYMPKEIAELNRQAEAEHCSDLIYAYEQTFGALDSSLRKLRPVSAATEKEARALLLANLGTLLPQSLAGGRAAWIREHERLSDLTMQRDEKGWHSFGLEIIDAATIPNDYKPVYLEGERRDPPGFPAFYLQFTKGSTEIGSHPTADVIV